MKIELWVIGKNSEKYIEQALSIFQERLDHYCSFEMKILLGIKNAHKLNPAMLMEAEGEIILKQIKKEDYMILLDENGKDYSSVEFSNAINKKQIQGIKKLVFLVGGAYGFAPSIYNIAKERISLSRMTFSHQMVRIFFVEQLYRAFTILKGEPYHNP